MKIIAYALYMKNNHGNNYLSIWLVSGEMHMAGTETTNATENTNTDKVIKHTKGSKYLSGNNLPWIILIPVILF